jgi:hypothetical protein
VVNCLVALHQGRDILKFPAPDLDSVFCHT